MKWKIRRYFLAIIESRRIVVFIKTYLFLIRGIGFKNLKISQFLDFMSIPRFYKLFIIFRLCSKINFENDLDIRKNLINNLRIALNFIDTSNFYNIDEAGTTTSVHVRGWVNYRYLPIISNQFSDFKTNLRRRDVSIQEGPENLYSGFKGIVDFKSFRDIVWEVPLKNNTSMKGKLTPTRSVATFYVNHFQESLDSNVDSAGFIDDVKLYWYWSSKSVANNLDFLFFVNIVSTLRLDFALKHVDHSVLDKFYELVASTAFNFFEVLHINTAVAKRIEGFVPIPKKVEFFKYRVQSDTSPRIFRLTNIRLLKGKFVVVDSSHVFNEFSDSLDSDLVSGVNSDLFNDFHNESITGCFTSSDYISLDNAIVLPSLSNSNWFHFIVESLAILVWFKDELPKDYPILMEHGVHKNIISILNLFDFNNILFIHPNIEIRVKNLITFSKNAIIVDSLTKDLNSYEINSELMLNLRDKISNLTNFSNAKNLQKDLFFFRRKSMSRSLIFRKNALKLIRKSGFEFVFIENFSLQDQINLCSKVDVLIMEGGASLTNFLFINSQCKILYFTNEMLGDYKLPEYYCSIFGLNLQIVTGRLKFLSVWRASTLYDLFHSNYSLSYSGMKKVLNELDVK